MTAKWHVFMTADGRISMAGLSGAPPPPGGGGGGGAGGGVRVVAGDPGSAGGDGPYDVIVCEGAVEQVPAAWQGGLAVGGRLGVGRSHRLIGRNPALLPD